MRHPADEDICPLLPKSLRMDGQMDVCRSDRKLSTGSSSADGQEDDRGEQTALSCVSVKEAERGWGHTWMSLSSSRLDCAGGAMVAESSEDELGRLDLDLSRKSKQLNLTSRNVRAILHVSAFTLSDQQHHQLVCHAPPCSPPCLNCRVHLCSWSGGDHP